MLDFQFSYNGLVLGPGTNYELTGIAGLDMPPLRTSDLPKDTRDGAFGGRDLLGIRVVALAVEINGTPGADIAAKVRSFKTAWNVTQTPAPLTYQLPGVPVRKVNGRPRRWSWPIELFTYDVGLVKVSVELHCMDPAIYDNATGGVVLV